MKRSLESRIARAAGALVVLGGMGVVLLVGFDFALSGWLVCGVFIGLGTSAAVYEIRTKE